MTLEKSVQANIIEAIQKVAVGPERGRDLSREHSYQVMRSALEGDVDEVQLAVLLIALRMKRESIDEFHGTLDALSEKVDTAQVAIDSVLTLAEPFDGYVRTASVTPFLPAVLAACGVNVVMHGVASVGPKHGVTANKVYAHAGMNVALSPHQAAECLSQHAWCYVDQQQYSPSLYGLNQLRDRIVKRTALTTLERLAMPIKGRSNRLALAYVHKAYPSIYAAMAFAVGYQQVLLFKGVEGGLAPAMNKPLRRFDLHQSCLQDIDAMKQLIDDHPFICNATAAPKLEPSDEPISATFQSGLAALSGQAGTARDSLCLAAANILMSQGPSTSLAAAVENVQTCLDNGSALESFNAVCEFSPKIS